MLNKIVNCCKKEKSFIKKYPILIIGYYVSCFLVGFTWGKYFKFIKEYKDL